VNRWIAPAVIAVVALTIGLSQFASAARLPLTPKSMKVFQLTTRPDTPKVLRVVASEDTWNDDRSTTSTHGNDPRLGVADSTQVCFVISGTSCTNIRNARTYLKFDLSLLPAGATVQTASLEIEGGPTTIGAAPVTIRRVTSSWTEAALTYNTRPSTASTGVVTGAATNVSGTMVTTFNLATDIANRATVSVTNGWEVRPNGTTDSWWYSSEWTTASQRPTLTVIYQ
jgi:hypothetical protein